MVMDALTEFVRPKRKMQAGDEMLRGRISRDKIVACFVERHLNGDPPPTYEVLKEAIGVYSTSSVYHNVQRLKAKGVLVKWGISYWLSKSWIAENLHQDRAGIPVHTDGSEMGEEEPRDARG